MTDTTFQSKVERLAFISNIRVVDIFVRSSKVLDHLPAIYGFVFCFGRKSQLLLASELTRGSAATAAASATDPTIQSD